MAVKEKAQGVRNLQARMERKQFLKGFQRVL
jgi:hypothetical protein